MLRKAGIVAIQEHKLTASGISDMIETFRASGWNLLCSPAEQASKRINAGVGLASPSTRILKGDRKTENFEKAYGLGRADKYYIDSGGDKANIIIFVIYGKSGDTKQARRISEAIIAACREEIGPTATNRS